MPDVELVPGTGQDWEGAARMAAARLHAHGPAALGELDVEALNRHPELRPPARLDFAAVTADLDARMEQARAARRAGAGLGNLPAGQARRDDALDRVDTHADPDWKTGARDAIRLIAATQPELTGDDLWRHVPKPAEPRASGAVFRWAATEGLIAPTDRFATTTQATSHAAPIRVWRSLTYAGERLL